MNPDSPSASFRPAGAVAVLGAGITGLTAAWALREAGSNPVVFEATPRVGGVIGSIRQGAWLHETGPNSLMEGSPTVSELLGSLGLDSRKLLAGPAARNRYVVRRGRPLAMPVSPGGFLATPLFSWRAKARLLGEPFRGRAAPDREESVAEFTVRRLGREFLDYAVEPLVGGVYAGDPALLSVRHAFPKLYALERNHGSLIRGAIALRSRTAGPPGKPLSFPEGLEELPRAIAAALGESVRTNARVRALSRTRSGWRVAWEGPAGLREEEFSAVVCALPADALASLRVDGETGPRTLASAADIVHPPLVSVFTGYRRADVGHALDGFGMLVPRAERRGILGTLFSSTLFPGRAPEGHVALTTFVGGVRNPDSAGLDDDAVLELVQRELRALLDVRGPAVHAHVCRWARAIPQYNVGFGRFLRLYEEVEAAEPGLFIGGNCRDGISLAACLDSGRRLAAAVLAAAR